MVSVRVWRGGKYFRHLAILPVPGQGIDPHRDPRRDFSRFSSEGHRDYSALLLSEEGGTLYVGARDALFALNTSAYGRLDLIKEASVRGSSRFAVGNRSQPGG
eukprot:g21382.t1